MTDGRNDGGRKPRPVREIPFTEIERDWELSAEFGSPAVDKTTDERGYWIRVIVGREETTYLTTTKYDYFRTDPTGLITSAPRGYAKDYRPGRITGMEEAVAKYARDPQATS